MPFRDIATLVRFDRDLQENQQLRDEFVSLEIKFIQTFINPQGTNWVSVTQAIAIVKRKGKRKAIEYLFITLTYEKILRTSIHVLNCKEISH